MTDTAAVFRHVTTGRSPVTVAALCGLLAAIGLGAVLLDLALGWILFGLLAAAPLLWDVLSNRQTTFEVRNEAIAWQRPAGSATIPAGEIAHIDLKLRLDRSIKLQVRLRDGKTATAPPEALPKASVLEGALRAAGYDVRRHPFALL